MKKHKQLVVAACLFMLAAAPLLGVRAQILAPSSMPLTEWQFAKTAAGPWHTVSVPHSYNAADGQSPEYYRGTALYRTTLNIDPEQAKGDTYLLFEGAAQAARVRLNGTTMARHKGGYTPFVVSITGKLRAGANTVEVECDNHEDTQLIPVSSDFNKNGGLHNPVHILYMGDAYFAPEPNGLYRMAVRTPQVSAEKAVAVVRTQVVNAQKRTRTLSFSVQIKDAEGHTVAQMREALKLKGGERRDIERTLTVHNPHLWDGVNDPYLYRVTLRLADARGRGIIDQAQCRTGFRFMRMDAERGFFLNGHHYPLRGVAMHQDMDGRASAVTSENIAADFKIIADLGTNFLRLAHYPHRDRVLQLCDSLGIIVQTEVPWVNVCGVHATKEYFDNIRQQVREMIVNQGNHPSIAFWGLWNELDGWGNNDKLQGKFDPQRVVSETNAIYKYAKQIDSTRFVGVTDCSVVANEGYADMKVDFVSENRYNGWYYKKFDDFTTDMLAAKKRLAHNPMHPAVNVAEYGAGANPFCHSLRDDDIRRTHDSLHYEDYASRFHESHVRQIARMPWLNFTSVWIMFDFPVSGRMEGYVDSPDGTTFAHAPQRMSINDKGIVSRDRRVLKDAFYLYRALWNRRLTTVHITQKRRMKPAVGEPLCIKVYSNARQLSLFQNGKRVQTLGAPSDETQVVWRFDAVRMASPSDVFRVVADDGTADEY